MRKLFLLVLFMGFQSAFAVHGNGPTTPVEKTSHMSIISVDCGSHYSTVRVESQGKTHSRFILNELCDSLNKKYDAILKCGPIDADVTIRAPSDVADAIGYRWVESVSNEKLPVNCL